MFVFTATPAMHRRALRAAGDPRVLAATCHRAAAAAPRNGRVRVPSLDIVEAGDSYTATLDMPGIAKEQFSISIEGRRVDISTQTAPQGDAAANVRAAPRYARSFVLPAELEAGAAQASLANGVLTLTLPKRAAIRAATVTVQ